MTKFEDPPIRRMKSKSILSDKNLKIQTLLQNTHQLETENNLKGGRE